jgi:hypothetical protein
MNRITAVADIITIALSMIAAPHRRSGSELIAEMEAAGLRMPGAMCSLVVLHFYHCCTVTNCCCLNTGDQGVS